MAHDHPAPAPAIGQRCAVDQGQVPIRVLHDGLEDVGHVPAVLEVVDAPRRHHGLGNPQLQDLVDGVVLVGEEVSREPGSVVEPAPPAEEALQAEGMVGRRPLELLPIDGLGASFLMNVPHPGAPGIVPVRGGLHQGDVAQDSGVDDLFRLDVALGLALLVSELEDEASVVHRILHHIVHPMRVFLVARHRLLDVDVLAGGGRIDAHPGVPVIRRGDDHRVHVVALQHVGIAEETGCASGGMSSRRSDVVGCRSQAPLRPDVEDVADARELDHQVVLIQPGFQALVARIVPDGFPLILDPIRVGEPCKPHQGLPLTAVADDPQTDDVPGRPGDRLGNEGGGPFRDTQLRHDQLALHLLIQPLLIPAYEEDAEDGNRRESLQEVSAAEGGGGLRSGSPLRSLRLSGEVLVAFVAHHTSSALAEACPAVFAFRVW